MEIAILNIIDKIYPIGSYYETSDETFDPNVSWGGCWIKDTDGLVTVGATEFRNGKELTIGAALPIVNQNISGLYQVTLKDEEMPSHAHYTKMQVCANEAGGYGLTQSGAFTNRIMVQNGTTDTSITGQDKPHINYQPSIGIIRWHRVNPCYYVRVSWLKSSQYQQSQAGDMEYFSDYYDLKAFTNDNSGYEIRVGAIGVEVTTIYSLFEGDRFVEKVDLSQLDTSNITSTSRLFYNCTNLKEVNLSTNDFSNVDTTTEMLNGVPSDCVFIVKDQTTKDWLLSIRSDLTGIQIK